MKYMILYLIWFSATLFVISHELREWLGLILEFKQDNNDNDNNNDEPIPDSVKHMYS